MGKSTNSSTPPSTWATASKPAPAAPFAGRPRL